MYLAMSDTVSSTSPGDSWPQFYPHNASGRTTTAAMLADRLSDATVVTTVNSPTTVTPRPSTATNANAAASTHLSAEGRVSKPARRRSRASRRTPTTLLNTDTANFRAMVQQFTGGPSASFATGPPSLGYGLPARQLIVNPAGVAMAPSGGYNLLRFQHQDDLQPPPNPPPAPHHHQQLMLPLNSGVAHGHVDFFLQRLSHGNSRNNAAEMAAAAAAARGFPMEGVSPHAPPSSSSENRNVNSQNYMF